MRKVGALVATGLTLGLPPSVPATEGQILVSSRVATAAADFAEVQEVGSLTLKGLSGVTQAPAVT